MPFLASAIARRTFAFMLAGVVVLLIVVAASVWLASRTREHAEEVTHLRDLRTLASDVLVSLLNAETSQRGYLLTQDRKYLEPFETAKPQLSADLDRLRELATGDADEASAMSKLAGLVTAKLAELSQTTDLALAGRRDAALAIVNSDRGKAVMDEIRNVLDTVIGRAEARVNSALAELNSASQILIVTTLAGGAFILIFAAGAFVTIARYTRELVEARGKFETLNMDLEQRVAERTSELSRANEEIQRFAYIVSHDLRAPLVNIMGFTSELEVGVGALQKAVSRTEPDQSALDTAKTAADEDIPEALRFIRASTTKMDGLINAILKLSREGRRELTAERVDLGKVFATAAASVQHQLDEADGRIDLAATSPTIISDRLALEQVFGNLIDNAVKYLAPGRPGRISIGTEDIRNRILISVSDNGRGIAEQDQERIFELFRRAGPQNRPGEGVGLAHVRALVRRLGGDISVKSQLGQGSTFRVDLPKAIGTIRESSS